MSPKSSSDSGTFAYDADQQDGHLFDITKLPTVPHFSFDLSADAVQNKVHLVDGTNSRIFKALLHGKERVIIKQIKEDNCDQEYAAKEFGMECEVLQRLR